MTARSGSAVPEPALVIVAQPQRHQADPSADPAHDRALQPVATRADDDRRAGIEASGTVSHARDDSHDPGRDPRAARTCDCGCGTPLTGRRADARYAAPACRTRAWKHRTGYTDQRAPKASPRRKTASGPPGLQVPFRKAVTAVTNYLEHQPFADDPAATATQILEPALPEAQRARLRARTRETPARASHT